MADHTLSEPPSQKEKRSRSKFKKSRGACLTCKIRHIKCDEGKPKCVKCSSTGRICEYHNPQDEAIVLSQNHAQSRVTIVPGLGSTRSSKEHRYFDQFRHRTMYGLMGVNQDSEFWRRMILQLSEAYPAVLHAVVAISALHEHISRPSAATERVYLQQYNKSIRHIRSLESDNKIQVTLACCIIFVCLENAQGNHERALEHLENGLRVYNVWALQDIRPAVKQAQEKILEIITRFDVQATSFWDSRKPLLVPDSNSKEPECGDRFPSLHAASIAQQFYELRIFYVLTAVSPKTSRHERPATFEAMFPHRTKLLHSFNIGMLNWKRAFDGLCHADAHKWSASEIHRSLLLQLHYQSLSLVVDLRANSRVETDLLPASETQRFQAIIDISRSVIMHATSMYNDNFLTADGGVIAPLYFIAMSAPNQHLYEQAIDLLKMVKKKEGFWQASAVLKVAEKVAERRREGTGDHLHGGVLELAELANVKFRTELFPENEGLVEGEAGLAYRLETDGGFENSALADSGLAREIEKEIGLPTVSCGEIPFGDDGLGEALL
ncbi:hypothetical protein BELL_0209g00060 [Botrytis elliptica]|uniref:Zn(2)-C6 fungal-type domain-containing protein n=1 Tax=Botrytis elliptica TaxID=278938 RepID=A0A4Z1JV47_9HELO|nr:hypothetical protein EAE99_009791 [Botrytis elliptica]TGO75510.1 hypothetical protein BELL_0209g00060 [Botrytis elliptica]